MNTTLLAALVGAVAMAGAAGAAEAPDGPMATAGASGSPPTPAAAGAAPARADAPSAPPMRPMTTAQQIDDFLASSPAARIEADELAEAGFAPGIPPERRVHGEVSVGVGSHGYRSVHARVAGPVGKNAWVSVQAGQTEGRGLYPGCYGPGRMGPWDGPGCGPVFGY